MAARRAWVVVAGAVGEAAAGAADRFRAEAAAAEVDVVAGAVGAAADAARAQVPPLSAWVSSEGSSD